MNKHTKGPWKLDGGKGKKGELYVWNNLNEPKGTLGTLEVCVATINGGRISPETIKANAALIIAAPDLLAALERLVDCVIQDESLQRANFDGTAMGQATKAIALAKGGA